MNVRQINLALQSAAVALASAALLSVIVGVLAPIETAPKVATGLSTATPKDAAAALPSVDSFGPIFAKTLQGSSVTAAVNNDPPPAETGVPVAQLTLVGSIGNSVALIKGPDGTVGMVELGDDVDGAAVVAIRPSQVDLRLNGKVTTLTKVPTPDPAASILVNH